MLIENFVLAIIFICLGFYEHYRMIYFWEVSEKLLSKEKSISRKLQKKKLTMKATTEGVKDYPTRFDFLFMHQKTDELLYVFGGRQCKSDFYDTPD